MRYRYDWQSGTSWREEQLKLPNPMTASPSAMLSRLKSMPTLGSVGHSQSADAFQMAAMNPLQMWVQFAEQWQKSWTDTMSLWTGGKPHDDSGQRRH